MPVTPELTQYINQARQSGMTDVLIRVELLKAGWNVDDVNAVLPAPSPIHPQPVLQNPFQGSPVSEVKPSQQAQQPKPHHNRIPFYIVVIILLLAGGFTYYFLPQIVSYADKLLGKVMPPAQVENIPLNQIPAAPLMDETAGWQMYRNEQYGFEVRYPTLSGIQGVGFNLVENPGIESAGFETIVSIQQFPAPIEFGAGFSVGIRKNLNSFDEIRTHINSIFGTSIIETTEETINGTRWLHVRTTDPYFEREESANYFTWQDGVSFRINYFSLGIPEFSKVLSTFKFIDSIASTQSISVLLPNGGEILTAGQTYTVRWNASGFGVQDLVYINLWSGAKIIGRFTPNGILATYGEYVWQVSDSEKEWGPETLKNLMICISNQPEERDRAPVRDCSDFSFTILSP